MKLTAARLILSSFLLFGFVFMSDARGIGIHGGVNLGTMPTGTSAALGFVVGAQKTFSLGEVALEANVELVKRSYHYFGNAFGPANYTPSYYLLEFPLLLKIGDGRSFPAFLIGPNPQFNLTTSCSSDVAGIGCTLKIPDPFSFSVQAGLAHEIKLIGIKSFVQAKYSYQIVGPNISVPSIKLHGFMFLLGVDF